MAKRKKRYKIPVGANLLKLHNRCMEIMSLQSDAVYRGPDSALQNAKAIAASEARFLRALKRAVPL